MLLAPLALSFMQVASAAPAAPLPDLTLEQSGALRCSVAFGLVHKARRRAETVDPGDRQLTALARALVMAPSALLADELTADLDPARTAEVLEVLHRAHLRGITILMATHAPDLARGPHRRVVHLSAGQVVSDDPPARPAQVWLPDHPPTMTPGGAPCAI